MFFRNHQIIYFVLARLRQLRVTNNTCEVHHIFDHLQASCWHPYSQSIEDKSDFFPEYRFKKNKINPLKTF